MSTVLAFDSARTAQLAREQTAWGAGMSIPEGTDGIRDSSRSYDYRSLSSSSGDVSNVMGGPRHYLLSGDSIDQTFLQAMQYAVLTDDDLTNDTN